MNLLNNKVGEALASRPRVAQGAMPNIGDTVPSLVFGLVVEDRRIGEFRSDTDSITGVYQFRVKNTSPISTPVAVLSVSLESNEDDTVLLEGKEPDRNTETIPPGESIQFSAKFDVDIDSINDTARAGCDDQVIDCDTEEVIAARLLSTSKTSTGEKEVLSSNCDFGDNEVGPPEERRGDMGKMEMDGPTGLKVAEEGTWELFEVPDNAAKYRWDWDDGQSDVTEVPRATHSYADTEADSTKEVVAEAISGGGERLDAAEQTTRVRSLQAGFGGPMSMSQAADEADDGGF